MHTLSVELPDPLGAQLIEAARRRGADEKQVIQEALQEYLLRHEQPAEANSFLARARGILDLPADPDGPTDLSTNPKHLVGYGQ